MTQPRWSWAAVILGLLLGLFAIFAGSGLAVWLGVMAVVTAVGLAASEYRRRSTSTHDPVPGQIPELHTLEKLLPAALYVITALIVLAALLYTLRQLGIL